MKKKVRKKKKRKVESNDAIRFAPGLEWMHVRVGNDTDRRKTCSKRKMEQNCHLLSKEEEEKKNYTKTGDNKLDNTFGFQTYYVYYYYYYYVFYYEQQSKKKKTTNSIYYDGSGKYSLSWPIAFPIGWHREYEL